MPETNPPIAVTGRTLADLAKLIGERGHPPVDRWNPDHCGNSDMRIAADGSWYHMGTRIDRPAMVRLFSTVLRREPDGSHVLVTPVEKLTIEVEVTAFRAIAMTSEGTARSSQDRVRDRQWRRHHPWPRPSANGDRRRPRPEPANRRPSRA